MDNGPTDAAGTVAPVMLTTNRKGSLPEAKIAAAAIEAGIGVARPLDDERYELIFDLGERLLRVQCKWAVRRGDVVVITCRTNRRGPGGFVSTVYGAHEIDVIAAYCAETNRSYLLPPSCRSGEQASSCASSRLETTSSKGSTKHGSSSSKLH